MWPPRHTTDTTSRLFARSTAHPISDTDRGDGRINGDRATASNSHLRFGANPHAYTNPYAAPDPYADRNVPCTHCGVPSAG